MKRITTLFALCAGFLSATAQTNNTIKVSDELSNKDQVIALPQNMATDADSLMMRWELKHFLYSDRENINDEVKEASTEEIQERLRRIPAIIEMPYNNVVRECINKYSNELRENVSIMLGAGNLYIPLFEETLDRYDLPLELKYLPIVESSLNPMAGKTSGNAGLWQLPLNIAERYGLKVNSLVDERRDPIKSTEAAAKYLKELYGIFNDWNLVIAAFNEGPSNINKAIHRADGKKDYWAIYPLLPQETRGYVPTFVAANYIMNYYCEHGIRPMKSKYPVKTDTLVITRNLHMEQIEAICGIEKEAIKSLNPQYRTEVIPGESGACTLRLPQDVMLKFIDKQENVYSYKASELLTRRALVSIDEKVVAKVKEAQKAKYVKIRRGDTLGAIAARNHTTVNAIKRLNHMRSDRINPGKTLRVR